MTPDALDRFIREAATALDLDPFSVARTEEGLSDLLARLAAERDGALYEASAAKGRVADLASERDAWKESCANVTLAARDARDAGKSDGRRELWMEIVGAVAGPLNARPGVNRRALLLAGPECGVSMLADLMRNWLTEQVDASAPSARAITDECNAIREMLLKKNAAYGDSALAPVRIFSKASPVEQILVRLDDKLSRLARGSAAGEDVVLDLIGYLILLRIAQRREREEIIRARPESEVSP